MEEDESASSDIVVRDKNGEVELDEPPTLVVDDPDEIALDMRQENESELSEMIMHGDFTCVLQTNCGADHRLFTQRRGRDSRMR